MPLQDEVAFSSLLSCSGSSREDHSMRSIDSFHMSWASVCPPGHHDSLIYVYTDLHRRPALAGRVIPESLVRMTGRAVHICTGFILIME